MTNRLNSDPPSIFDEAADAQADAPKPRSRRRWILVSVIGVLIAVLLAVGGSAVWYFKAVDDGLSEIKRESNLLPVDSTNRPAPPTQASPPLNVVIMGSDSRGSGDIGRSDVLMLLHIPADRKGAYLISIPRDYWVNIPGRGRAKINAAYAWGGAPLTVATVEQLLDVRVDHVAKIDFEGFMRLVDAVGGVTVNNRYTSTTGKYHFPKGPVHLHGDSALMFVRERKNLPNGDFDRAERQRDVIKAITAKLMSRGVLASPGTFRDSIISLGRNLTVDEQLTNDKIMDLGMSMRIGGADDIKSFMVPLGKFGTSSDGQWYVSVNEEKLAVLKKALREDKVAEYLQQHG